MIPSYSIITLFLVPDEKFIHKENNANIRGYMYQSWGQAFIKAAQAFFFNHCGCGDGYVRGQFASLLARPQILAWVGDQGCQKF